MSVLPYQTALVMVNELHAYLRHGPSLANSALYTPLIRCMLISQPIPGAYQGALVVIAESLAQNTSVYSCTILHTVHRLACTTVERSVRNCASRSV